MLSRPPDGPASPMGRHGSFTLPPPFLPPPRPPAFPAVPSAVPSAAATAAATASHLVFDSFYFQSQGGAVLHGLVDGDVVSGPLWDGNLEVLDSATAIVHGNFYARH